MKIYINTSRTGYREYRAGETSRRPWTSNNQYRHDRYTWSGNGVSAVDAQSRLGPTYRQWNDTYEKFRSQAMGNGSQLLTAAAEWKTSLSMIANRAAHLRRAYLALRKGNFAQVGHHLTMPVLDRSIVEGKIRKQYRSVRPTEAWLEYWMGWAPMLSDIYNAVDNICSPYPDQKITVGVTRAYNSREVVGSPNESVYVVKSKQQSVTTAAYGKMRVTNHNLFLANQLGLLNPAQTAWEIVPFSFMVDWVFNVGKVLGSLTDFAGLSFEATGTAMHSQLSYNRSGFNKEWDTALKAYRNVYFSGNARGVEKLRNPGSISPPRFAMKFDRLSLTRGATSISLLTEAFISGRK